MILTKSPGVLNFLINHSAIYPVITQDGDPEYLDATEILKKPDTYFFLTQNGGLLFWGIDDREYETDIYFLPRQRGAVARSAAKQALAYMFGNVGAKKITALIPACNKASMYFTTGLGFERAGVDPLAWVKNGVRYDRIRYEKRP